MLAAMNGSLNIRNSSLDLPHDLTEPHLSPEVNLEDRLCPGCRKSAIPEDGGVVVAFGQSFFHVDCFRCAKCTNKVTADTNLLLLSDGSPVCSNCSYSCSMCNLPILDEAIMTGEESYHAHCFTCKICKNRIPELMFAKTRQGIYCMPCHHERMAKIRQHNERKAARSAGAGGSSSSSSRKRTAPNSSEGRTSPLPNGQETPSSKMLSTDPLRSQDVVSSVRSPPKQRTMSYVTDAFESFNQQAVNSSPSHNGASHAPSSQPISVTLAPSANASHESSHSASPSANVFRPPPRESSFAGTGAVEQSRLVHPVKQNTLPLTDTHSDKELGSGRRQSYDGGFSSTSVPFRQGSLNSVTDIALSTSSVQEKRRSINPGLVLNNIQGSSTYSSSLSPNSTSFRVRQEGNRSSTPPVQGGRDSPHVRSPINGHFADSALSSRPTSYGSVHSHSSDIHSTSPSPTQLFAKSVESASAEDHTAVISPPLLNQRSQSSSLNRQGRSSGPLEPGVLRQQRSFDDRSISRTASASSTGSRRHSRSNFDDQRSRSTSRSADVPHSVESGTDTEAEREEHNHVRTESRDTAPRVPTKESTNLIAVRSLVSPTSENDFDASQAETSGSDENDIDESSPVERTSHSTYIAPALSPIRLSINAADFSDLLGSVGGLSSVKSLSALVNKQHMQDDDAPLTPPPSARSDVTIINPMAPPATQHRSEALADEVFPKIASKSSLDLNSSLRTQSLMDSQSETFHVSEPLQTSEESSFAQVTFTASGSNDAKSNKQDTVDLVLYRLQEALSDAKERGAKQLKLDRAFVEAIVKSMETNKTQLADLKGKFDGVKRASMQYIEGLTVAQTEYDRELKARRDAEAEVTRLRVLLSGQAARLTALSGDSRRQELRQQMTKDLNESLSGLEQDLSKLKAQRDIALAEVEELFTRRSNTDSPANLGRSLSVRLDNLKIQYQHELIPLIEQQEALSREIAELKAARDIFLEETTVLNARNEELAQLSAQYARRMDSVGAPENSVKSGFKQTLQRISEDRPRPPQPPPPSQQPQSSGPQDDNHVKVSKVDADLPTPSKKFKWPGSKQKEVAASSLSSSTSLAPDHKVRSRQEHNFQQLSVLRFTRCDHCGDTMWGSPLRCTVCNTSVHPRCINHLQMACFQRTTSQEDSSSLPLAPSMFGRDLTEQGLADAKGTGRQVPVIVEKCINAVEAIALDYEGIYRKSGGSGQTKMITQLFERGHYDDFDLCDTDRFNDICSVTSVLKTYFRSLPNPLLTFDLHDQFISAMEIRDPVVKSKSLLEILNKLPDVHYFTLRTLMLHLHRVFQQAEKNRMSARNLGVVFGPTLMRSRNPGAEFSDMAGKALTVEWLIENGPVVFSQAARG